MSDEHRATAEVLLGNVLMGRGHTFDPTRLQLAQIHATLAVAVEVEALRTSVADVREELRGLRGLLTAITSTSPDGPRGGAYVRVATGLAPR